MMAMNHRVVITGAGVVSSIGRSTRAFWNRLITGCSGIGPLERFDACRFSSRFAFQVPDTDAEMETGAYTHEIQRMDRFVQYAFAAAEDALTVSALRVNGTCPPEGGVFIGVGMGGLPNMEAGVLQQEARGPRKISPYLIPSLIPNMAASLIALKNGIQGPQYTFAGACASGMQAIGEAMQAIRSGKLTWAIAGGTEAVVTPISFSGFEAMHALSPTVDITKTPRPFDQKGNGMILGEGAAIFVLEARSTAENRRATINAELEGYATSSGGPQIVQPLPDDMARCMKLALKDGKLNIYDIDCVYAQAAGLRKGDACELEALQDTFVRLGGQPAVTSIKAHIGHTFAASGPLNLLAALGTLRTQRIPATLNLDMVAPEYTNIDIVQTLRVKNIRHCLINSFGFGGIHASLIASKYER